MAATAGRTLRVKVSTTLAGTYTVVADIDTATFERDGTNVDTTSLTDSDIVRIQAMKDAKFTLSGNYNGTDTLGQVVLMNAYENNSQVFVEFLPDGTTGFKKEVKVSKIAIGGSVKDKQTVSFDLDGTGATSTV